MKRNLFFGLALFGIAFAGAAFTANKNLQANHYLQKPTECLAIPVTTCVIPAGSDCLRSDGTGTYQVFGQRTNPATCNQRLSERQN